ncbi:hypothetical protein [Nonomuraea ceibae]|uniref:hypothetical protein n=1 Tax=Nonomuraea ceibae TaxID=1935170 RepID=UPI001C5E3DC6|nr:hypothetical protein [Nonomuraea ceibae]
MHHNTAPALEEVPWPDEAPSDLNVESLPLCCIECSNSSFTEVTITTDQGHENALECTWCGEVYLDAR